MKMNVDALKNAGKQIVTLADKYVGGPKREMLLDPALYGYLLGSGCKVDRQFHVRRPSAKHPLRIDFRIGGQNPVLLEFAVRPPKGGGQLSGSQNQSELRKLSRFSNAQAKLRALLLLDLHDAHLEKDALKPTFDVLHAGPGKFKRFPVQVIYVHKAQCYSFLWKPFKPAT